MYHWLNVQWYIGSCFENVLTVYRRLKFEKFTVHCPALINCNVKIDRWPRLGGRGFPQSGLCVCDASPGQPGGGRSPPLQLLRPSHLHPDARRSHDRLSFAILPSPNDPLYIKRNMRGLIISLWFRRDAYTTILVKSCGLSFSSSFYKGNRQRGLEKHMGRYGRSWMSYLRSCPLLT